MQCRLLDVVLGCLDGEVINLVNAHTLPGEGVAGRVVGTIERLFTVLTAQQCDGVDLVKQVSHAGVLRIPELVAHLLQSIFLPNPRRNGRRTKVLATRGPDTRCCSVQPEIRSA